MQRYGRYWSDDDEDEGREERGRRGWGERAWWGRRREQERDEPRRSMRDWRETEHYEGRRADPRHYEHGHYEHRDERRDYGRERRDFGPGRYGRRTPYYDREDPYWGGPGEWGERGGMREPRDWGRYYGRGPDEHEPSYGRGHEPPRHPRMRRGWREHDAQRDYGTMRGRPLEAHRQHEGGEHGRWHEHEDEPGLMERIGDGIRRFFASDEGRGPHAGKGPKGYRRSDERIREDVCDRIATWGWVDASDVEVDVRDGEVTLTGQIRSRRDKRMLEEMIEHASGVRDVHNQLRVPRDTGRRAAPPGEAQRNGPGTRTA